MEETASPGWSIVRLFFCLFAQRICLVFLRAQKYSKELVGDPSAGSPYHKNEPMFLFGVFQQENQLN